MKKLFSVLMVLTVITSFFDTKVLAASTAMLTPTLGSAELGQLKVCKAAGVGVTVGKLFTINVNNIAYSVPAGPTDGGYCVLAGQFPVNTQVTVQESIPNGYYVSRMEVTARLRNTTMVCEAAFPCTIVTRMVRAFKFLLIKRSAGIVYISVTE